MSEDSLGQMLAAIPEVSAAIKRIPGIARCLKAALGSSTIIWDPDNDTDITNKILIACAAIKLEELCSRIDEIETKYRVVKGAETNWKVFAPTRDHVTFINDAGHGLTAGQPRKPYSERSIGGL